MSVDVHPLVAAEAFARQQTDHRVYPVLVAELDQLRAEVARLDALVGRHVTASRVVEQQHRDRIHEVHAAARRHVADDLRQLNEVRALVSARLKTVRMDDLRRALGYVNDSACTEGDTR